MPFKAGIEIENQEYKDQDFSRESIIEVVFENCRFENCNFTEADLLDSTFREVEFEECDFTNTNVADTAFQEVSFSGCKLMGIAFHEVRSMGLEMRFDKTRLELCLFHDLNLSNTPFINCEVIESEFIGSDLTGANFSDSDLSRSIFKGTDLKKAQFQTARNFRINPSDNHLKGARFSRTNLAGLLKDFGIVVE